MCSGHVFMNPTHEILQLAKDMNMDGRVHVVTFGVNTQMQEVKHALQDCIQSGYWLVLQNAHLAAPWTKDMLQFLKVAYKDITINTYSPHNSCQDKLKIV